MNFQMNRLVLLAGVVLLVAAWSGVAGAQVRQAPSGNSLPENVADASPSVELRDDEHDHVAARLTAEQHGRFAEDVDLAAFRRLAVSHGGRTKIVDTLAREYVTRVCGKPRWRDAETGRKYDPVFTFLDLLFNKPYYDERPLIYVEVLDLRRQLVRHLPPAEQEVWLKRGRLSPRLLASPEASATAAALSGDLMMHEALKRVRVGVGAYRNTAGSLVMVSPPPGGEHWGHLFDLEDTRLAGREAGVVPVAAAAQVDQALVRLIHDQFANLQDGWLHADAGRVNAALRQLAGSIPRLNPETYPAAWFREVEYVYNATHKFTVGHWVYFAATILLLVSFGTGRAGMIGLGVGALGLGFAVHTAGLVVRMILAGRWPIHNQFESFMAITWFATLVGAGLMWARRQWLFGAAAAALGGCSLLLANTYPIPSHDVGQVAGILATSRILYVHVNMVLASYGLIALGFFVSVFYLFMHYIRGDAAVRYAAAGLGVAGGAGAGAAAVLPGRQRLLNDLDKAQMVLLQLAFWILGVGILLGAYWADHAWGRWWAWDPKETWALITWIVYLIVVHVRVVAKNRALVTAWLSVLGFFVMLWTYWGVNLLLAGLHSYA